MALMKLPAELLLQIVEESRPDGFESLALTCSPIFSIAKPMVEEHNRLKELYSSTALTLPRRPWHKGLHNVLINALAPRYVTSLHCHDPGLWNSNASLGKFCRAHKNVLGQLLHNTSYLARVNISTGPVDRNKSDVPTIHRDLDRWWDEVLAGFAHPLIAILLLLLPNLEEVSLAALWDIRPSLYFTNVINVIAQDASEGKAHPLSHLHTLEINGSGYEYGTSVATFTAFLALPSLKKLKCNHVEAGFGSFRYPWPYSDHCSNLEDFELSESAIGATVLENILSPMQCLRTFKYSHTCLSRSDGLTWNADAFVRAAARSVGSTLEELSLTDCGRSTLALQSLKSFLNLRKLELGVDLLLNGDYSQIASSESRRPECTTRASLNLDQRLSAILPTSVQEIVLIWNNDQPRPGKLFASFAADREEKLPVLAKIHLKVPAWAAALIHELRIIVNKLNTVDTDLMLEAVPLELLRDGRILPAHQCKGQPVDSTLPPEFSEDITDSTSESSEDETSESSEDDSSEPSEDETD